MQTKLLRKFNDEFQSLGSFIIFEPEDPDFLDMPYRELFECYTLEPPKSYKGIINYPFKTRILPGIYPVRKRWSLKFRNHLEILDVPGRTDILMHPGSFFYNTEGCIQVGSDFKDLNKDGVADLIYSRKTLNKILRIVPEEFTLEIFDED